MGADAPDSDTQIQTDSSGLIRPGGKVDPDAIRDEVERLQRLAGDDVLLPRVRFELQRDPKQPRLDRYLSTRIGFMSRNQLQQLIEEGSATVNDRGAKASTKLRAGDVVELVVPPPPPTSIQPERMELDVMFEDDALIILNKRAGVIVHPARTEKMGTIINGLAWHFRNVSGGELSEVGSEHARPGVVHRLDRDTTGCIVFAKTEHAHWKLGAQFEKRTCDKRYLALVEGTVGSDVEVIDKPIGPHPSREKGYREKMVVRHDDLGKPSVTICRVRERYRLHDRPVGHQEFSLVELELKTGRTHQIRVHMTDAGHPLVGDDMYAGRFFERVGAEPVERQMLHAALLAIEHPETGETLAPVAPLPPDFRALLEHLRSGRVQALDPAGSVPRKRLGLD